MKNKIFASLAVATTLGLLIPAESYAFGLGHLKVHSALNQPLNAEISLTAVEPSEEDNIQVKLASNAEFSRAGLERTYLLTKLKFKVVYNHNKPRVVITSDEPIREPFLDFLIAASAGEGKLIREYTVLLDPPKQVFNEEPAATTTQSEQSNSVTAKSAPVSQYSSAPEQYGSTPGQYGPTSRSETLWHIASQTRPEQNLSVNQMMMAILKANPKAFQDDNVNGLKAGYTLAIPSAADVRHLSKTQAIAAVREQNRLWKNRNRSAESKSKTNQVATNTVEKVAMPSKTNTSANKVTTSTSVQKPQTKTTNAQKAANQAKLELVSPETKQNLNDDKQAPQGDKKIKQLTEQLTLAQESIEAQKQENVDMKQRMSMMEEQLKTLHRLINLKDTDMARIQSLLAKQKKAPASVTTDASSVTDETLSAMNQPSNSQINLTGDTSPTVSESTSQATTGKTAAAKTVTATSKQQQPSSLASTKSSTKQPAQPNQAPPVSTVPESQVDQIVDKTAEALNLNKNEVHTVLNRIKQFVEQNQLETGLGALLILLILWLIVRRRNRVVTWGEAVDDISDNEKAPVETFTTFEDDEPLAEPEVTEITGTMPDVRVKTVEQLVDQADMFVGYADYVQAKSSLEQARAQEPDNAQVIQKLLFVLYKQKQIDAFVSLAQAVELNHNSEEWHDIATWGRELAPSNALFTLPVASLTPEDSESEADVEVETNQPQMTEDNLLNEQVEEEPQQQVTAETDTEQEQTETDVEEDGHIDFDLSDYDFNQSDQTEETEEVVSEDEQDDENLLAFDLDTVGDETDAMHLDILEKQESELESVELDKTDADEGNADEHADLTTLNFDIEPDVSVDDDSLQLDDTELASISDEELEEAAQALGRDETEEPSPVEQDNLVDNLEFDIGDFDDIDEAETKLDLAAAYIDMGDPDGAKSILEEVVNEGNDEQKSRAQTLLQSLAE